MNLVLAMALLTSSLLSQDPSAPETLRRLIETVEKAKSFRASFRAETVVTDNATGMQTRTVNLCSLAVGRPGKLYYYSHLVPEDRTRSLWVLVDAGESAMQVLDQTPFWDLGPVVLRTRLLQAFGRGGGAGLIGWLGEPWEDPANGRIGVGHRLPRVPKPEQKTFNLMASDPQWAEKGTLTYTLKVDADLVQVALTLDPKTLIPLKRVATFKTPEKTFTRTESYGSYDVDVGISDDDFGELIGESPEARTLRKIESAILNANTIRVKFSSTVPKPKTDGVGLPPMMGEIILKGMDKAKLILEGIPTKQGSVTSVVVCDGTKVSGEALHLENVKNPARVFQEMLRVSLCRPGILVGTYALGYAIAFAPKDELSDPDFGNAFEFSSIAQGEPDQGANTLILELRGSLDFEVKIWYDPKDYRIQKRQLKSLSPGGEVYLESYSEFLLDVEIPDETFRLPEEKK